MAGSMGKMSVELDRDAIRAIERLARAIEQSNKLKIQDRNQDRLQRLADDPNS